MKKLYRPSKTALVVGGLRMVRLDDAEASTPELNAVLMIRIGAL